MNAVKFTKLSFKNLMHYGNNISEFTFPEGFIWLRAECGVGKSAIMEALTFALFGKSYRGGSKDKIDLKNTRNTTADMMVRLEFSVEHGGVTDVYAIERRMSPKGRIAFSVNKNGEDVPKSVLSQDDFETNVIGFNFTLWKNVIALNATQTVPFIQMEASEKRALIESMISVSVDNWKKCNARVSAKASFDFDAAQADIERGRTDLAAADDLIGKLTEEKRIGLAEKQKAVADAEIRVSEEKAASDAAKAELTKAEAKLREYSDHSNKKRDADARITVLNRAMASFGPLQSARDELNRVNASLAEAVKAADERRLYDARGRAAALSDEIVSAGLKLREKECAVSECSSRASAARSRRDAVTESAKKIVPGTPCPKCGKPSTEEECEKIKASLRVEWKSHNDEMLSAEKSASGYRAEADAIKAQIEDIRKRYADESAIASADDAVFAAETSARAAVRSAEENVRRLSAAIGGMDMDACASEIAKVTAESEAETSAMNAMGDVEKLHSDASQASYRAEYAYRGSVDALSKAKSDLAAASAMNPESALAAAMDNRRRIEAGIKDAGDRLTESGDMKRVADYIAELCSDNGMKKLVIGMFIPTFNKAVARNLKRFGLPYSLSFDDTMEVTYRGVPGESPSYTMLSGGQLSKGNFAISMAFREFVSAIGNFSVNMLFLDEIVDVNCDNASIIEMLSLGKSMVRDVGCVLVVSHHGDVAPDVFDGEVCVKNDGMFSRLSPVEMHS